MSDLFLESSLKMPVIENLSAKYIKQRVKDGCNPNERDERTGRTLLFNAVYAGRRDLVRSLIMSGASAQLKDKAGDTVLHLAAFVPVWAVRKEENVLSRHFPRWFRKDLLILQDILNAGVDVNVQNNQGATPMHNALESQNDEVVDILCEEDYINLNLKDCQGRTCLHKLAEHPTLRQIKQFTDLGADPRIKDKKGATAYDIVSEMITNELHISEITKEEREACKALLKSVSTTLNMEKTAIMSKRTKTEKESNHSEEVLDFSAKKNIRFVSSHGKNGASNEAQKEKE